MFFQTTVLLRWIVYLGLRRSRAPAFGSPPGRDRTSSLIGNPLPGLDEPRRADPLVGGFIIISTGVTGLYIGKIFEQVKGRPLYVVDERRTRARASTPRSKLDTSRAARRPSADGWTVPAKTVAIVQSCYIPWRATST